MFPSWHGSYDGSQPTLDGLDHNQKVLALENGLITHAEINALLGLMKNPKVCVSYPVVSVSGFTDLYRQSHYLKVPTLPFYTLVSILSKFPADADSRVFYSGKLRDMLFG